MTIFAKVVVILASIWPICIKSNESTNDTLSYVHDHNFLFISGWPQSGTSLMQMMFTVAPQTSTMVRKCNEMIPGNKCIDWNFEGQWIVKFGMAKTEGYYASALLNSGAMCKLHVLDNTRSTNPDVTQLRDEDLLNHLQKVENGIYIMNETERTSAQRNVLQTWGQFWNLDMPLLVEKSPHLMLKTKQLRSIYTGAKSVKFIAVIKVSNIFSLPSLRVRISCYNELRLNLSLLSNWVMIYSVAISGISILGVVYAIWCMNDNIAFHWITPHFLTVTY